MLCEMCLHTGCSSYLRLNVLPIFKYLEEFWLCDVSLEGGIDLLLSG